MLVLNLLHNNISITYTYIILNTDLFIMLAQEELEDRIRRSYEQPGWLRHKKEAWTETGANLADELILTFLEYIDCFDTRKNCSINKQ